MMWAISRMTWSPPLLFWRGLMDAAKASFSRFNPQDFSNCITAGAHAANATRSHTCLCLCISVAAGHVVLTRLRTGTTLLLCAAHLWTWLLLCTAAVAVDVGGVDKPWLAAFIQASQPRLDAFEPVQLANTGVALASISATHSWAALCISAAWLAAFVQAATVQLGNRRLSARNLQMIVSSTRTLHYVPMPADAQMLLQQAEALLRRARPHNR